MCLDDDDHASLHRTLQNIGQSPLGQGVQVDFGLLKINQLARSCCQQCDDNREGLRDAKPDIRDADEVARSALLCVKQTADF